MHSRESSNTKIAACVALFITFGLFSDAFSAALTQAEVTRVYNQVSVVDPAAGKRPAVVHDVVKGDLGVETGVDSRAELLFPDNTLTRLAANTFFSFKDGTREMDLSHGAILFQIPKGVGGAKINTAAITAAITGTTGFVERAGDRFKLILLEGTVKVYYRDRTGESMVIHGGQMLVAPINGSMKDWSTVDVDIAKIMKTSVLLKPGLFDPLAPAAEKLIAQVIEKQNSDVKDGQPDPANTAGGLSTVTLVENSTRNRAEAADPKRAPSPRGGGGSSNTPTPTPSGTATPSPTASPTAAPTATPTAAPTATPTAVPTATPTAAPTATPTAAPTATPTAAPTATPTAAPTASPTAAPTATPSPSPSPTATAAPSASPTAPPTAAATPNAAPTPNLNPAPTQFPPLITTAGPYVIKGSTVIDTTKVSPSITTDGTTNPGMFFVNVAKTGSPSQFLFGTTSVFDNRMNFDNQYNANFANSGVFKFSSLQLEGNPTFLTKEGANKVALVSQTDISSSPIGGTVNLNGIDSLFLGTESGSINLSDKFTFTKVDGSPLKNVQLYARNGNVDFGSLMDLKRSASLNLAAENNVHVLSTAFVNADNAIISALGNATVDGTITSHFSQLYAGSALTINGSISADNFYGFGNTATINGSLTGRNLTLQTVGDLNLTAAGALNAIDKLAITTGGAMNLAGATADLADASSTSKKYTLTAGTDLNISGRLTASDFLDATAQNANITNTVTGKTIGFTLANSFNMSGGAFVTSNDLNISAGGGINLGAVNNNNAVTLTAGTNALLGNGAINFNGSLGTKNLNATGTSITVNSDIAAQKATFTASKDFTTNAGGRITTSGSGNSLNVSAAGLVTVNGNLNGNNIALSSGTNRNLPGALTINGNVQSQGSFTASGPTELINGTVSGKDATFTAGIDFRLANGGVLNLTGNGVIAASKTLVLDGKTTAAGWLNLNGLADMTVNGQVNSQDVTVEGSDVTFNNAIAAKHFTVNNQGDFLLGNSGSLTATDVVAINSRNGVTLNGPLSGKAFSFSAGRDLVLNGALQTPGSVTTNVKNAFVNSAVNADTVNFIAGTDFDLGQTGSLTTVHDINVTATNRNITLSGSTDSNKLNLSALKGAAALNGDADAQLITVSAKSASIGGQLESASDMNFTLSQNFTLTSAGSLNALGNYNISGQAITLDGASSGNTYKLTGTKDLTVNGMITAQDFQASADGATFNSKLASAKGISLNLTGDFVTGAGSNLSAVNNVSVTALGSALLSGLLSDTTLNLSATRDIVVNAGANLQSSTSISLSGLTASIYGRLVAPTVSVTGTSGLLLDSTTGFISADVVTLNSASGTLSLASSNGGTGGLDGARLDTLKATGASIDILTDFALNPGGTSTLTAGQGGIDATGHDLSGFDTITLNSGDYTGDSLSADTVVFNNKGDLDLTGDLYVGKSLTTPGSITVAGVLDGQKISAAKIIDAGTVAAADVTAATLTVGDGGIASNQDQTIAAPTISWGDGGIMHDGAAGKSSSAPLNATDLTLTTTSAVFDANGNTIKSASLTGGDADPSRFDAGGNGGTLNVNTTGLITVNAPIIATTGLNSRSGVTGGNGGTVNLTSNSTITVNSQIQTSSNDGNRRVSARGGKIKLDSKATNGTAIQIGSTANLQALLSAAAPGPGGTVTFKSAGGAVNVNGGTVTADRGTIDMRNTGLSGKMTLTNATLSADVVKAGALGDSGVLTIGGGAINANTMLKLYAGGSNGLVNFVANVSLNGNSTKIISANTVTIQPTVVVTIGGPNAAQVYTSHPNYTGYGGVGKGYGTFGGAGAVTIKPGQALPPGF